MKKWTVRLTVVASIFICCTHLFGASNVQTQLNNQLSTTQKQADLVIFSYDRPLQLYAFLESLQAYVKGIASTQVICRISHADFEKGYDIVKTKFPHVRFIKQGPGAPKDFKRLLLKAVFAPGATDYIMFGVDDLIMTDHVDISQCIRAFEQHGATGFFLRLGKNITSNYTINITFDPPPLSCVEPGMFTWAHGKTKGDWSLSASTDMTIYRKKDIRKISEELYYYNPNNFELQWINSWGAKGRGICFAESKVINIPYNIVQENKQHRNMNFLSPRELLDLFLDGSKIDISSVSNKKNGGPINKAPHMEFITPFVKRGSNR